MPLVSTVRIIKYGSQNFYRNFWLSLVTVFILMLTLFSVSLVYTLNVVADNAIKAVKEKVDIDLFFEPNVPEDKIMALKAFLESRDDVKKVTYVSQEQAIESFKEEHKDDQAIQDSLAQLEKNPLPATLIVQAIRLEDYSKIIVDLDNSEYSRLVSGRNFEDSQTVIDRLSGASGRIYQVGLGITGIFIVIAILVVFNAIRMNIYTQREELGIKKLVGATNMFIRMPFMVESVLYALLASIVTSLILFPLLSAASPYLNSFFEGYDFNMFTYFTANFLKILGLQILVSVIICVISSMIAIGKYLRV